MSAISNLIAAEAAKVNVNVGTEDRAAKVQAANDMAARITKIVQENPDLTVTELGSLILGGLSGGVTNYKAIMKELVSAFRLVQIRPVNPYDIPLAKEVKAAAKAEQTAKPEHLPTKRVTKKAKK